MTRFLRSGECERVKADVHAALGLLALGAFVYNAGAFCLRRKSHLAVNAVVYGALIAFELSHVAHHQETT